jgi:hypothetical protein
MALGGPGEKPWGKNAPENRRAKAEADRALGASGYRSPLQRAWDRLAHRGEVRSGKEGSAEK